MNRKIATGILTISDRCSTGEREDESGPALAGSLPTDRFEIVERATVPDDLETIAQTLRLWSASCDLLLTTGGTGFSPRDVTPEATRSVIEREAPGLAEAMRSEGLKKTPFAMLSRGVAGTIGPALVINFPGSPKAVREGLSVLLPVLEHAVSLARGETPHS